MADISKINVNSTEYNLKDAAARSQLGQLKTAAYKDITNSYDATSEDAISGKGVAEAVEVESLDDTAPYVYRQSPAIGTRMMENALVGGSVAWNQLVLAGYKSFTNTVTDQRTTVKLRVQFTGTNINLVAEDIETVGTYNYVVKSANSGTLVLKHSGQSADIGFAYVNGVLENHVYFISIKFLGVNPSVVNGLSTDNVMLIDLTALFGTTIADYVYSLEQSTAGSGIAWLKENGFDFSEYHEYDAGSLQSVCVSGKKVVGKNLFDKDTMVLSGYVSSSGTFSSSNSGEKCICVPAPKGTYNLSKLATTRTVIAYFANIPTNGQSGTVLNTAPSESVSVTIQNDGYIVAFIYNNTGETNTLQNVLDSAQLEFGSTATTYEPYTEHTIPLDHKTLRGIFKLQNNKIVADGDVQSWDGVVTRKYVQVKMQNLTVNSDAENSNGYLRFILATTDKEYGITNVISNMLETSSVGVTENTNGEQISGYGYSRSLYFTIKASRLSGDLSTQSNRQTALNNWLLQNDLYVLYELATPTTETSTPFDNPQISYVGGTEGFTDYEVSQGNRDASVPVGHLSEYKKLPEWTEDDYIVYLQEQAEDVKNKADNTTASVELPGAYDTSSKNFPTKNAVSGSVQNCLTYINDLADKLYTAINSHATALANIPTKTVVVNHRAIDVGDEFNISLPLSYKFLIIELTIIGTSESCYGSIVSTDFANGSVLSIVANGHGSSYWCDLSRMANSITVSGNFSSDHGELTVTAF